MTTMDAATYRSTRPTKRMAAGILIRDGAGRVLLVEPTYKPTWELPGGCVEADESPRSACVREVREELGLDLNPGRMLCMEWQGPEPDRTESLMFIYDGGVFHDGSALRLPPDELASFRFVHADDLDALVIERLARRIRAALLAVDEHRLVELEGGVLAAPSRPGA